MGLLCHEFFLKLFQCLFSGVAIACAVAKNAVLRSQNLPTRAFRLGDTSRLSRRQSNNTVVKNGGAVRPPAPSNCQIRQVIRRLSHLLPQNSDLAFLAVRVEYPEVAFFLSVLDVFAHNEPASVLSIGDCIPYRNWNAQPRQRGIGNSAMSNVLQRLRKLEAQMTDGCGYVPHSEAWFEYWAERYDRFLATGDGDALKGMTLDFILHAGSC